MSWWPGENHLGGTSGKCILCNLTVPVQILALWLTSCVTLGLLTYLLWASGKWRY